MDGPIDHRDVTTIMGLLGDLQADVKAIRELLKRMAKKNLKMTADEKAQRAKTQRMVRERIAYHEARAREADERRTSRRDWRALGRRLRERLQLPS